MSPARWKKIVAKIIEAYHITPRELARLTRRQIWDLYLVERDEKGHIKDESADSSARVAPVEAPPSLEKDLCDLAVLAATLRIPEEKRKQLHDQIVAKWKKKEESPHE